MNFSKLLILVLMIVAVLAVVANFSIFKPADANILIYTNGTNTDVTTQGTVHKNIPSNVMNEIKDKVSSDVLMETSTDQSIKSDIKAILSDNNYTANIKIVSQFGTDKIPMIATVNGTSMVPTLQDGQSIVVLKTKDFKVGDIVVAVHPRYGLIVKRVSIIEADQVYLTSDNKDVEVVNNETQVKNGSLETVTVEKKPLNTWLPLSSIIGIVKIYCSINLNL
jgi:signal peptidase I